MCDQCCYPSRRDLLKLGALLGAGASPLLRTFASRVRAEPDAPLRIGYLPITDATPLLVAHDRGLFKAEGVEAEAPRMFRSWAQLVEAFVAGQVNAVHLLSPMTVWARFGSKIPAKVVAWNHVDGSALTVAPSVNKLEDLGGKTVAVPFWYSIHNVVLQRLLKSKGLAAIKGAAEPKTKEVKLVVIAPSDMPPALAGGQIAGYIVAEPFNAAAEQLGVGKILRFTGDVWRNHACCVVFMHERDLTERAAWSEKVVTALVKAQHWTRGHRAETAKLLSKAGKNKYTPHTPEVLAKVLAPAATDRAKYQKDGAIQHADWSAQRIDFQPYPYPSYTEELIGLLKDTLVDGERGFLDKLDPKAAAAELVDDRFVKKALTKVGGPKAFGLPESLTRSETIVV